MKRQNISMSKLINTCEYFILQNIERADNEHEKTLRKHLNDDICIYVPKMSSMNIHELPKDKLRSGETSAEIYSIGSYVIRDSLMLYRDDDKFFYTERIPAEKEKVDEFIKQSDKPPLFCDEYFREHRLVREIHAAYKHSPEPKWKYICSATSAKSYAWSESINFIGTVKKDLFTPDKQSELFVLVYYCGDSFSTETWYMFSPDTKVKTYSVHPYNPESENEKWD